MTSPAPSLRLEQNLIVQGDLTMVVGGIPVMSFDGGREAETVVNFLRCGCLAVQLTDDHSEEVLARGTARLKKYLDALAMSGEEFIVAQHSNAAEDNYHVLIVTRVAQS